MYRARKSRKIVIGSLLCLLLIMSVGYAVFQSRLEIKGSSKITSNWDVRITNVTQGTVTGDAENTSAPTWTDLTANMEANLYEKGAKIEYDVTISNRGTFDAKLDNILTTPSSNEAVIITFSGYTKGEKLAKGQDKIIHVTIEYNPNYNGTAEVSGTSVVEFNYVQDEGYPLDPVPERYLLTYNYGENGGTSSNAENEYIDEGTVVNLQDKVATKPGWTFIGWNTDKDAHTGINTTTMTANTTLYAIFKKDITVSYVKGTGISKINNQTSDYSTNYTLWNKDTSQSITLPSITLTDSTYSELLGWYDNDTKIGNPSDIYAAADTVTLIAKARNLPIMKKWTDSVPGNASYLNTTDFHTSEYRTKITSIEFVTTDTVPGNAIESWDVSEAGNGSVKAWITADPNDNTKYALHIGGEGGVIAPDDLGFAFKDFTALTSINFTNLDTSNTEDMYCMFESDSALTSIVFGNDFDTSKVKSFNYMFTNCSSLTSLDLSGFDTRSAEEMAGMFHACGGITGLNLSNFDTSNVTTMDRMFANCSGLTNLNLSNFDTSKVKSFSYMFTNCSSLTSLDLSSFDTSNVTAMEGMFQDLKNIKTLNLNNFNTSKVTNMEDMFNGPNSSDSKLELIYLCTINTNNVASRTSMFQDLPNLKAVYVGSSWTATNENLFFQSNISSVTKLDNCKTNTENPVIKSWTASDTTDFHASTYKSSITSVVFENNTNVPSGATSWDVSAAPNSGNVIAWVEQVYTSGYGYGYVLHIGGKGGVIANENSARIFDGFTGITSINFNGNYDTSSATTMEGMFKGCSSLTSLDLSGFDTSNVTNMGAMFRDNTSLTSLNISSFDTSKVTHMAYMFADCNVLPSIDVSNFDTSKVTRMDYMFYENNALTTLDVSNFDTSNVTLMTSMFDMSDDDSSQLTTLTLGDNWNTSKVTAMNWLFANCNRLTNIDVSTFDTKNVTTMAGMFYSDKSLTELNLTNFDTNKVTDVKQMFDNCPSLTTIYASRNFTTGSVNNSTNMFYGDTVLVGGVGTTFNSSKIDKEYARIDKTGEPGYFTLGDAPVITNISDQTTTNSATIIIDAFVPNGENITSYEYSIDGGTTWVTQTDTNISPNMYTFTGLTAGTTYNIQLRVTSESNNYTTDSVSVNTKSIGIPTYSEGVSGEVVITYPTGCASPYSCSYKLDDGEEVPVTTSSVTLPLGTDGVVDAKVTDGTSVEHAVYNLRKTDLYVSRNGNDTTGVGTVNQPYATINKAYEKASPTADATIYVMNNINQSTYLDMNSNKNITLTSSDSKGKTGGYGYALNTITRTYTTPTNLITSSTGTLKLRNIVIDGNNIELSTGKLVVIANGEIDNGTVIQNSKSGALGISGGIVTMNGGTIRNNDAPASGNSSAVEVMTDSTLIMNGGTISNNTAGAGAGLYTNPNSTTTINGGSITNNIASGDGGGGIYSYGTLNISDGIIAGNTGGYAGGGIIAQSTVNITGGEIYNNTAGTYGGGIYIGGGTLDITGGTISNNSAEYGGGIFAPDGGNQIITISGSTTSITNNNATTGSGGAIYAYGTLNVSGGSITSNKAHTTGGAIICKTTCSFTGGSITGNTATTSAGSGLRVDGTATIGGTVTINNNTNSSSTYTYPENISSAAAGTYTDQKGNISIKNAAYYIIPRLATSLALDVTGGTAPASSNTNVQVYTKANSNRMKWKIYPRRVVNGTTQYGLTSAVSATGVTSYSKYLYITSSSPATGTNAFLYQNMTTGTSGQWTLSKTGSYYKILNVANSKLCLSTAKTSSVTSGTNVNVTTCVTTPAATTNSQQWTISAA